MPIPEFIVAARQKIGHELMWLPGVTALIFRGGAGEVGMEVGMTTAAGAAQREILLVQRADNGQWTPVTGICEPGEQPDVTARREAAEETGVDIVVDRLVHVRATRTVTYPNGDQAVYMDTCFSCHLAAGSPDARVGDEESVAVGWYPLTKLPPMKERFLQLIAEAEANLPAGFGE